MDTSSQESYATALEGAHVQVKRVTNPDAGHEWLQAPSHPRPLFPLHLLSSLYEDHTSRSLVLSCLYD